MHKIGVINLYIGVLITVFGLCVGFYQLIISGSSHDIGWLGVVPVGVLFMFLGTVMSILSNPSNKRNDPNIDDM